MLLDPECAGGSRFLIRRRSSFGILTTITHVTCLTEPDPLRPTAGALRRWLARSRPEGLFRSSPLRSSRPPHGHEPTKSCHCWRRTLFVLRRLPPSLSCAPDEHPETSGTCLRPFMVALRTRPIRCCSRSPRSQGSVKIGVPHRSVLTLRLELHSQVR